MGLEKIGGCTLNARSIFKGFKERVNTVSWLLVSFFKRVGHGVLDVSEWLWDDTKAMGVGVYGNVSRIAMIYKDPKQFLPALVLGYDWHGGPGWGNLNKDAITTLGKTYRTHDINYDAIELGVDKLILTADLQLLGDMWTLSFKKQPGPFGQTYRIGATAAFTLKLPYTVIKERKKIMKLYYQKKALNREEHYD